MSDIVACRKDIAQALAAARIHVKAAHAWACEYDEEDHDKGNQLWATNGNLVAEDLAYIMQDLDDLIGALSK